MDRFSVDAEFEGACGAVEVLIDTLEDVNFERPVNHVSGKIRKRRCRRGSNNYPSSMRRLA